MQQFAAGRHAVRDTSGGVAIVLVSKKQSGSRGMPDDKKGMCALNAAAHLLQCSVCSRNLCGQHAKHMHTFVQVLCVEAEQGVYLW